jgi:hypothetical protein
MLHSGCGMTSRPNIPTNPTPTPTPTPTPDTTAPTVTSFAPAAGANNVRVDANVTVTFIEAMDPATVNGSTVELRNPSSALVPATVSYDAGSRAATLDPTTLLSAGVTYTARVKGGSADPRVKDVAGNALAADATWTFTTTAPLQVLSTTPTTDATDVPTGLAPKARFSKPLNVSTLIASETILLQDAAGNPVPFTRAFANSCFFQVSAFILAIVPSRLLQPLQTYTVTLKGGPNEPHITDSEGTPLESDFTWSFTTAAAKPMTIFAPDDTPAISIDNDPQAVELGLKFRSDIDGLITGVRFRGFQKEGEHVGHLWTSDGTLLGSATFNRLRSDWQQALFQTPIPITANTTYVVSYFAPQGPYVATPGQFASSGVDTPPLHALRDGVDGGNGVFLRSPTGGFPTQTSNSTNHWVDVVFSDSTLAPPQVLSTLPKAGERISVFELFQLPVTITFSEPIDPTSVNNSTVQVTDTENHPVGFGISFSPGNFTVTLVMLPTVSGAYTVTFKGGVDAPHITDATGTPLAADYTFTFIVGIQCLP